MHKDKLFITPHQVEDPALRLFCFPFAGGSTQTYLNWVKHFEPSIEVVLVQPPGRGTRFIETPHDNMNSLIRELLQFRHYITEVPYVFLGHSLGSRVAYELCYQFIKLGLELPKMLMASGSRAPHTQNEEKSIYDLPHREFIQELKTLEGTPEEVLNNKELMDIVMPVLRADFKIADTYKATPIKMPFPISVFYGKSDNGTPKAVVNRWRELTGQDCTFFQFPGGHFFIERHAEEVLKVVIQNVNEVQNTEEELL